jgi:hypothetical protein
MDALYFGNNGNLIYSDFKDVSEEQKKDFIGQFHCNPDADPQSSLAGYILKPDGKKFVREGYCCAYKNRQAI